ncbi:GGDEF domain-containing protein [Ferdinandcohnia sp. Marseille-Q9671]
MKIITKIHSLSFIFRYGGEEFGVVVKNKNQEEAFLLAETLRNLVEVSPNPTGQRITISLGISSLYKNDEHGKQIVERADNALYKSKTNGRNRTTLYIEDGLHIIS